MRRSKPPLIRNKLDLADRVQVRLVKKRLHLSDAELSEIVDRIGNSISAISKEATVRRANVIAQPPQLPPAAVIATVTATDAVASEMAIGEQAP